MEAAIDEHDEPFYGKTPQLQAYTMRSRAKQGTTHFFRMVSADVICRTLRRVRIKTTSRNPAFRFVVLGFALLLVNLWAFVSMLSVPSNRFSGQSWLSLALLLSRKS